MRVIKRSVEFFLFKLKFREPGYMSNRLFQTVIHQMKDVIGRPIGVIDENGIIVSCSELGRIGESRQRVREELLYSPDVVLLGQCGPEGCFTFISVF